MESTAVVGSPRTSSFSRETPEGLSPPAVEAPSRAYVVAVGFEPGVASPAPPVASASTAAYASMTACNSANESVADAGNATSALSIAPRFWVVTPERPAVRKSSTVGAVPVPSYALSCPSAVVAGPAAARATACSSASVSMPAPLSAVSAMACLTAASVSAVTPVMPSATRSSSESAGPTSVPFAVCSTRAARVARASISVTESTADAVAFETASFSSDSAGAGSAAAVTAPMRAYVPLVGSLPGDASPLPPVASARMDTYASTTA